MPYADPFFDKINAVGGITIALLSYVFGEHWSLFFAFLCLNVGDWVTGWMKSYISHKESSVKGIAGILKKLGYWILICVAFGSSVIFIKIGIILGIDLRMTTLLGWFVLASLIVNETRSILENLVECGYTIPKFLVKGLEIADKMINSDGFIDIDETDETPDLYHLTVTTPIEEVKGKDELRIKINPSKDWRDT